MDPPGGEPPPDKDPHQPGTGLTSKPKTKVPSNSKRNRNPSDQPGTSPTTGKPTNTPTKHFSFSQLIQLPYSRQKELLRDRLLAKVTEIPSIPFDDYSRVADALCEMDTTELIALLEDRDLLKAVAQRALSVLSRAHTVPGLKTPNDKRRRRNDSRGNKMEVDDDDEEEDDDVNPSGSQETSIKSAPPPTKLLANLSELSSQSLAVDSPSGRQDHRLTSKSYSSAVKSTPTGSIPDDVPKNSKSFRQFASLNRAGQCLHSPNLTSISEETRKILLSAYDCAQQSTWQRHEDHLQARLQQQTLQDEAKSNRALAVPRKETQAVFPNSLVKVSAFQHASIVKHFPNLNFQDWDWKIVQPFCTSIKVAQQNACPVEAELNFVLPLTRGTVAAIAPYVSARGAITDAYPFISKCIVYHDSGVFPVGIITISGHFKKGKFEAIDVHPHLSAHSTVIPSIAIGHLYHFKSDAHGQDPDKIYGLRTCHVQKHKDSNSIYMGLDLFSTEQTTIRWTLVSGCRESVAGTSSKVKMALGCGESSLEGVVVIAPGHIRIRSDYGEATTKINKALGCNPHVRSLYNVDEKSNSVTWIKVNGNRPKTEEEINQAKQHLAAKKTRQEEEWRLKNSPLDLSGQSLMIHPVDLGPEGISAVSDNLNCKMIQPEINYHRLPFRIPGWHAGLRVSLISDEALKQEKSESITIQCAHIQILLMSPQHAKKHGLWPPDSDSFPDPPTKHGDPGGEAPLSH